MRVLWELVERDKIDYKIKHLGSYSFIRDNQIIDRLIIEMIKNIDATQQEYNYEHENLGANSKKIDLEARNYFHASILLSILKYIIGFNQYSH